MVVACYKWSSNKTEESLDCGIPTINSPVVRGAPVYWFHPLSGPSKEWRPCPFPSLPFPIMTKLGIQSFALTPGVSGLILISFWGIQCLLAFLSIQPHQSSSLTQFSQEWVLSVQKGGRKTFNKSSLIVSPIKMWMRCYCVVVLVLLPQTNNYHWISSIFYMLI